jgi:phosphatidate cytidylyltransferase
MEWNDDSNGAGMGRIELKRVWTGVLLLPPLVLLIVLGPFSLFSLLVLAATFFGLREFYRLALPHSKWIERGMGMVLGLILSILVSCGEMRWVPFFFVFSLLILSVLYMVSSRDLSSTIASIGMSLFGILYVGFLLSYIFLIRKGVDGKEWVLFLVATVWAGDICAYLGGTAFGRHKLYPKISPNKTFEGLAGAVVGSVIVALVFSGLFLPGLNRGAAVLFGIGLALFGQVGDFIESMLKRSAQVKDSGSLIPGHGGMLDRLDSLLFTAPFLHYSLLYLFQETP